MELSLSQRFTYGNVNLHFPDADGRTEREQLLSELLEEGPKRQRAVIALGQYQIQAQERFAHQLAERTEACAEIVVNEISKQTVELRDSIERVSAQLSDEIALAAHEVSAAVYDVGARLAMNLEEVEWQLVQQNETLDRILHVLQETRSNEARQLISQGVRLYNAGAFDRAEERFRRALDFDATDYQVLMNLGFIEIHNEHPEAARKFFKDALTLPAELDASAKARTIRAMATLEAALANYNEAIRLGDQLLGQGEKDASLLYLTAIWSASAGDKREALRRVKDAILMDPRCFSKVAIEPAFLAMHAEIVELLMALASSAQAAAQELASRTHDFLERLERNDRREEYAELSKRLCEFLSQAEGLFLARSYSGYRLYCTEIQRVGDLPQRVLDLIAQVDRNRVGNDCLLKDLQRIEREAKAIGLNLESPGEDKADTPASCLGGCLVASGCGVILSVLLSNGILGSLDDDLAYRFLFLSVASVLLGMCILICIRPWHLRKERQIKRLRDEISLRRSEADASQEEHSKFIVRLAQMSEALSLVETRKNPDTSEEVTMDTQM